MSSTASQPPESALDESVKERIQSLYRQLLEARNLTPRYGQRLMIAEIAKSLGNIDPESEEAGPVCVVEAGTGTGKTLAYLLASIPLAQAKGLKVVVATATVALQEQVMQKDIPELLQGSDLEFNFALAKGRGRYLCLSRLDMLLRDNDSQQAMMDLYGEELDDPDSTDRELYTRMLNALSAGDWQGDRDDWVTPLRDSEWRPVTVDNSQCSGARCSHFRNCCFYRARDALTRADCIVTNHDLVLSDLALGGGVILPEPENAIYIFDEAHHLPLKSNNHFASFSRLKAAMTWLERCENMAEGLNKDDFIDAKQAASLKQLSQQLREQLNQAWLMLEQILDASDSQDSYDNRRQHTFELGVVPSELLDLAGNITNCFSRFAAQWELALDILKEDLEEPGTDGRSDRAEQWYPLVGSTHGRAQANLELWFNYSHADKPGSAPSARWLSHFETDNYSDITLSASPVLAAENLQQALWQNCAAAVLTSATLSALGNFNMLAMRAGLPANTRYLSIASPFDFAGKGRLVVPRINCLPTDNAAHSQALIRAIPQLLEQDCAALMLFASRRQMQEVLEGLDDDWREKVLCQDDYQKAQLLKYHRSRVDKGEGSLIFGLASFAEGVDLPGKYCTHVLIAKIPFAVPNDPVEMTLSAWIEQQGENPFLTLSVPDAAFRLVQASGRLLRNENDSGQITLFDERIVSRQYGKQILDSLPPYSREIFQLELGS